MYLYNIRLAAYFPYLSKEEHAMTTGTSGNRTSYVYAGLAGETAPGRVVQSGLYRMADGDTAWELLTHGLPETPAIRAITVHPQQPEIVYVGTYNGPYRTTDHGEHWEKVNVPDHGTPGWSLRFHPRDACHGVRDLRPRLHTVRALARR